MTGRKHRLKTDQINVIQQQLGKTGQKEIREEQKKMKMSELRGLKVTGGVNMSYKGRRKGQAALRNQAE